MTYYQAFAALAALSLCTEAFNSHNQPASAAFVPRGISERSVTTKPAFLSVLVDDMFEDEPFSESTLCVPVSTTTATTNSVADDANENNGVVKTSVQSCPPETRRERIFGVIKTKAQQIKTNAKNRLHSLEERLDRRNNKVKEDIKQKAQEIKTRATTNLAELENRLEEAIQQRTDEIINTIAVDFVTLLNGHWDLGIATNKDDTRTMMEGSIEELADDLIEMGIADEGEKDLLKDSLDLDSRLHITSTIDGSDGSYPLRLKQEAWLGSKPVIEFYGQLQFDLLEHQALYSLDELSVLGTQVDLDEIIRASNDASSESESSSSEEEEEKENDDDDDDDEERLLKADPASGMMEAKVNDA